ncbi:hypothetical protein J3459_010688 [Metarhizium acridum]|nr:hypothetical protein J3459_010688 [Metarhizium acridum]
MYNNDRVQQLEHKYIELLEKRIASLEALVKKSGTVTSEDAQSAGRPKADEHQGTYNEKIQSDSGQLPMTRLRERVLIDEGVPEIKDIDPSEFEFLDRLPPEEKAEPPERTYKLTWYRVLSEKRKYKYSEIDENSPELQALLRVALSHYPRLHFPSDGVHEGINFKSPFIHLIHNWDKLEALTEDDSAEYRGLRTKA